MRKGEYMFASTHSSTRQEVDMTGQLHGGSALSLKKYPPLFILQAPDRKIYIL
jgi:hypothetical protein